MGGGGGGGREKEFVGQEVQKKKKTNNNHNNNKQIKTLGLGLVGKRNETFPHPEDRKDRKTPVIRNLPSPMIFLMVDP